jgi:hypothetical protein
VAAATRSVAETREERRKEREEKRQRENGPTHQSAPFMRRDAFVPRKAAYRTSRARVGAADGFRFRFRGPDPPNSGIIVINMRVSLALTSHWLL